MPRRQSGTRTARRAPRKKAQALLLVRNRQLALLFACLFIVLAGFGLIIPTLPFYARSLGATPVHMGLLITVWAGAQFTFAPFWGGLSDRIGRKPVLLAGLLGFSGSFLMMALAQSVLGLMVARLLGGMLSAAALPTAQAFIADVTRPEDRGPGMALIGATFGLGFVVGPALGGLLAPYGVTVPFYVAALAGLATVPLAWKILPETNPARLGGGTAGGAGAGASAGAAPAPAGRLRTLSGLRSVALALRTPYSIFFHLAFVTTFAGSSLFAMLAYYLMDRFSGDARMAGLVFTVQGVTFVAIQGLLVGRIIRRLGEDWTTRLGLVLGIVGFTGISLAPTFPLLVAAVVLASGAMSLLRPSITAQVSRRTTLPQGITLGIQSSFDSLGRTVGPLWAGTAFALAPVGPYVSGAVIYGLGLAAYAWQARRLDAASTASAPPPRPRAA